MEDKEVNILVCARSYFDSLEAATESKLRKILHKKEIVEDFLQFAKNDFNYDKQYFLEVIEPNFIESENETSIVLEYVEEQPMLVKTVPETEAETHIYHNVLGFFGNVDLFVAYNTEFKKREKDVNDWQKKFDNYTAEKNARENIKGKKREFIKYNEALKRITPCLEAAKKELDSKKILDKILNTYSKTYNPFVTIATLRYSWPEINYYDPRINVDEDWKSFINFAELSVSEMKMLREHKKNNYDKYINEFESYVESCNIMDTLVCIVEKNYYLHNRIKIFKEAKKLFDNELYLGFTYLLMPQIEGLLKIWAKLKYPAFKSETEGLSNIADEVNKYDKNFWEYIYFRCELPLLRNYMEHGEAADIDEEKALDCLMDVYFLARQIESKDFPYMQVVEFLNSCKKRIEENNSKSLKTILDFLNDRFNSKFYEKSRRLLKDLFNGEYDEILSFYELSDIKTKLLDFVKSENFRKISFDVDVEIPLENSEFGVGPDGNQTKFSSVNDDAVKYYALVQFLRDECNVDFDEGWFSEFSNFKEKIEKKHKEFRELIKQNPFLKAQNK